MKYAIYHTNGTAEIIDTGTAKVEYLELSKALSKFYNDDGEPEYDTHSTMIESYRTTDNAYVYINEEGRLVSHFKPNPFYPEDLRGDVIEYGGIDEHGDMLTLPDDYKLREIAKLPDFLFEKGHKVSLIYIGQSLPATVHSKLITAGERCLKTGKPAFKEILGRKLFTLNLRNSDFMLFKGHDLPFCVDGELQPDKSDSGFITRTVRMNALYNLGGATPETIKDYVLNKQLNPFWIGLDRIHFVNGEDEQLLFPHVAPSCAMVASKQDKQLNIERHHIFVN
jgi:hypothetical protein